MSEMLERIPFVSKNSSTSDAMGNEIDTAVKYVKESGKKTPAELSSDG
jgi:hypothetical protein